MTDKEKREKAIKKLNEIGKIVAFLKTDDETYSAGKDLDKIQQDLIRFFSALLQPPCKTCGGSGEVPIRHQPCGCVICICEGDEQCQGCGAKYCDKHDSYHNRLIPKKVPCPACKGKQPQPSAGEYNADEEYNCDDCTEDCQIAQRLLCRNAFIAIGKRQAQTIVEQGIRLDTVNRIGKEACEELDQLQNENTEQAEEIRQMKDGLISVRKSTEIMEARRFADQALGKKGE